MDYRNNSHYTKYSPQPYESYSNSAYANLDYTEQQHEAIRGLVTGSRDLLTKQDRKIAKLATEREDAYKIYKVKRDDHIMAKKERAAINKNVKYAESAFNASKRKIIALDRMERVGPKKAQQFEAEFYRAQGDVELAMNSYDGVLMDRVSRARSPPIKMEDEEDDFADDQSSYEESCIGMQGFYSAEIYERRGLDRQMRVHYGRFY